MSNYVIVLPVYNAVEKFRKYTYKFLTRYKLQSKCLFLIQNDQDAVNYGVAFPDIKQERAPPGYYEAMNFISQKLPNNKKIVKIDDDFSSLKKLVGDKLVDVPDVNKLYVDIFDDLKKKKLSLAGFYPMQSAIYMKEREAVTTDLRFIQGAMYCFLNKKIPLKKNGKADYIFTIENYIQDGGVIRYNHIGMKYQFEQGNENPKDLKQFLKEYDEFVSRVITHKGGTTSILLRKNP